MTEPNDSIHALSGGENSHGNPYFEHEGLTKREYFAAMAMQGFLASGVHARILIAELAVKKADELIEELNR